MNKQDKTEETLKLQPQAVGRKGQGIAPAELLKHTGTRSRRLRDRGIMIEKTSDSERI